MRQLGINRKRSSNSAKPSTRRSISWTRSVHPASGSCSRSPAENGPRCTPQLRHCPGMVIKRDVTSGSRASAINSFRLTGTRQSQIAPRTKSGRFCQCRDRNSRTLSSPSTRVNRQRCDGSPERSCAVRPCVRANARFRCALRNRPR